MSSIALKVISKEREIIHVDLKIVAKEVEKDCCHASLECRMGVT